MFDNPRHKMILEQTLAMYDSSCHAKYALSMTVFRETIRTLGTPRHEHILSLDQNHQVRRADVILLEKIDDWFRSLVVSL